MECTMRVSLPKILIHFLTQVFTCTLLCLNGLPKLGQNISKTTSSSSIAKNVFLIMPLVHPRILDWLAVNNLRRPILWNKRLSRIYMDIDSQISLYKVRMWAKHSLNILSNELTTLLCGRMPMSILSKTQKVNWLYYLILTNLLFTGIQC